MRDKEDKNQLYCQLRLKCIKIFIIFSILYFQNIYRENIVVGDLVKIYREEDIPCDLLLLYSTEEMECCYITTSNLDGETNLKVILF